MTASTYEATLRIERALYVQMFAELAVPALGRRLQNGDINAEQMAGELGNIKRLIDEADIFELLGMIKELST